MLDGVRQTDTDIIKPGDFTEIPGTGGYMAWFSNSINANTLSIGQHLVQNTGDIFHLGIFNGFPGAGQGGLYYGYYSDFGGLNIGATVAGTNSTVVRACYGDSIQLYAYGGTNYLWTPDTYLDDATSNMPTAINLPPGPHNYTVQVSGACKTGSIPLTILVSTPVVAFFQTNVSSGCSPLDVHFEDQSSGAYSWQYEIDDTIIRYDLNPATPYPEPPGYPLPFTLTHIYRNTTNAAIVDTVTLLVKNESGCADIFTKTITVFPEVQSEFSFNGQSRGCDPLEVRFVNNSTGDTDTWYWEFGDGGSSIEENPQHTYRNLFGPDSIVYDARLIAISPYYCRDTSIHPVTVMPYIEANFVFDTVFACTPHQIIITDQSFGADFYYWDFGDGTSSTTSGPQISKTYINNDTVPVTYTIRLRVENKEGCFDEVLRDVTVFPEIDASFSPDRDEGCSPFEVAFLNNSHGAATYYWSFGDGGTSDEDNPVHLYDRNLTDHDTIYTVTLVATSSEFCRDTAYYDILVHPYIEAAFAVDDIVGCHPFTITINNLSVGAEQFLWDFGDGSPVSNTSAASFDHLYLNTGNTTAIYPLQLIVRNSEGCSDTLVRYITVHPEITANFTASAFEGCHPLTVSFTDLSLNAENYYWEFGDGSSSAESSPVHTFTNYGLTDSVYTVTLTTSTGDGECVKSVSWPVVVHPQTMAGFTVPVVAGCTPFEAVLENMSLGGTSYHWDFGDGSDTVTSSLSTITHTFINSDFAGSRTFEITLTVQNDDGCSSEARRQVTVYPDIRAGLNSSLTEGCHPLTVDFTNLTLGGDAYTWEFGDGATSALQNASHTFLNTGTADTTFTVLLTAFSSLNNCFDTASVRITVHPFIRADFTIPDQLGCNPFDVTLYNSSVHASVYRWNFGDGTDTVTYTADPVVHHFINTDFSSVRDFEITLVAENFAGCTSEIKRTVSVLPDIAAGFNADQAEGCHPLSVDFSNVSNGSYSYFWDFGDGSSSSADSPGHIYTNFTDTIITRQVRLIATSIYNCSSEITGTITIHPKPKARFFTDEIINCPPLNLQIINASINADHYSWRFGDGDMLNTDLTDTIAHSYDNLTGNIISYDISLTATSDYGCVDSTSQGISVYPATVAGFSLDREGCSPLTSHFTNESLRADSYLWDFGDGSRTSVADPTHIYYNFSPDGISYYVTLTSVSMYGCVDTETDTINVYPQPEAEFIALPGHQVYPSATVNLTNMTNAGLWSYLWDMGDGFTTSDQDPLPHTYSTWGEYNIVLAVSSAHCNDTVSHTVRIFAGPPVAVFDTVYPGCEPLAVHFTNHSLYGDTYLWEFDDGTSSDEFEPVHTFINPGVYNVKLTVTGEGGRDYYYRQVEVYPNPLVDFRVTPDLVMLPDQEIQLYNLTEGGVSFLWDFGDGVTSTDVNPRYKYTATGTYDISLQAWTEHGCTDKLIKPDAVTVVGKGLILFPNAFMPDMTGPNGGYYNLAEPEKNNIFHPYWEGVEIYRLEIFDRWGMLIYVSDDVMKGWDGYYQDNVAQQGVYVWKCTGKFTNGKPFSLVGDVTLLYFNR